MTVFAGQAATREGKAVGPSLPLIIGSGIAVEAIGSWLTDVFDICFACPCMVTEHCVLGFVPASSQEIVRNVTIYRFQSRDFLKMEGTDDPLNSSPQKAAPSRLTTHTCICMYTYIYI